MHKLELFNEKSFRLQESRFYIWLRSGPKKADIEKIIAGDWLAYAGLHPDDLDAFCFNLRHLIQERDGYHLQRIPALYEALGNDAAEAVRLAKTELQELEEYLKQNSIVQIDDKSQLTNWGMFEILFYGGLAHTNEDKVAPWRRLTREGAFSVFTFWSFIGTVHRYMNCINKVTAMNQAILKHHAGTKTSRHGAR